MGISYLQPERQDLSKDGRFYMLSYKFIKQKARELRSIKDYIAIMKTLEQLHDHDHVHSDVRELNLLFPQDTNEAMLIDFDLMDTVDTLYPNGYSRLRERHPDAKAGKERKKIHDRYALVCIIEKECFYIYLTEEQKKELQLYKNSDSYNFTAEFYDGTSVVCNVCIIAYYYIHM